MGMSRAWSRHCHNPIRWAAPKLSTSGVKFQMNNDKERESTELLFWSWNHDSLQKMATIGDLVHLTKKSLASPSPDFDRIGSRPDKIDQLSASIMNVPPP